MVSVAAFLMFLVYFFIAWQVTQYLM